MRKIWNKGHRIRASDKHLVYHFSIGTLLFVFVAVLLLLNIKQLMRTDWEHFSLFENGLTLSPYNFITILISTGVCALVAFSVLPLLLRQFQEAPAPSKSWQEWYWKTSGMKPIPYKTAVFLLTCKADQGKKSSGFQRFIIKWKRDCFISAVKLRWGNIKTSFYG